MEIITIKINWTGAMSVHDGKLPGAREWYHAPGLIICKHGATGKFYDRFANLACNEAIARHIPLISLRRIEK